ncbi:50S ribosomal protein L24 [Candidatus Cyrtobacter comes]|uniref:Large ribosomal subunit protein uL24 n=2 Tax=Candidatus Cyrtobacter comes TaxID=675776 RepID=A0ABU5L6H9_9RICK|nr:50S ribosomal protein L24 [Candidatus Cyrtobacter comes]
MRKFKKGDKVLVRAGSSKGKSGVVLKILRDDRAVVDGVGIVLKHSKPSRINPEGGKIEKLAGIHISNLSHIDPVTGKATRVGVRILEDGTSSRFYKKSGQIFS